MNVSNGDGSLEQDANNKTGTVGNELQKLLQMKVMPLLERN